MSKDLIILVPVLGRPWRVEPLLESIERTTSVDYRVLFLASPGDRAEQDSIRAKSCDMFVMPESFFGRGDYAKKINRGCTESVEPYIFLGADDLEFHSQWFENAMQEMVEDTLVVGTNDLGNPRVMAGEHATHSLVNRRYLQMGTIDESDKLLHEGYPHDWVDNEFVETAKYRHTWGFAFNSIVEHLHPNWGKAPMDRLYSQQAIRMRRGREIFARRRHLWA